MAVEKKIKCGFEVYEITEAKTNSRAVICPERGGILLELELNGKKVFYLDEATFEDRNQNIRGGNPILFPICGPLTDNKYVVNGEEFEMKQHGFARNMEWDVEGHDAQSITLSIQDTDETYAQFPFAFLLTFTYMLEDGKMHIHQQYENHSKTVMPFYAGFHPYFVANHAKANYEIPSKKFYDTTSMKMEDYNGNLAEMAIEPSKAFVELEDRKIVFGEEDNRIAVEYSDDFPSVVFWSVKPEEYVCVEPWMAGPNAYHTKDSVVELNGGQAKVATLTISNQ